MEHTLGRRLKVARAQAGMTASALAHEVGVTEDAIRKIESGSSKQPSFSTGLEIARALGVSPLILAFGESDSSGGPPVVDLLASTIRTLRFCRPELEAFGVAGISIFGSVARGDATPESDVDVLIETREDVSFSLLTRAKVGVYLRDRLMRPVDVVTKRNIEGTSFAHVLTDAVRAF